MRRLASEPMSRRPRIRAYAAVLCVGLVACQPALGAERPGSLAGLADRARVVGFALTGGGDHPFPAARVIRSRTGFGVSPNAYRCPRHLGGLTFFRQPGGLGLSLLWRGPRHVSRVDLGRQGQIIGAARMPCRKPAAR